MAVEIPVAATTDAATTTSDLDLSLSPPASIANGDLLLQVGICVDARTLSSSLTQLGSTNGVDGRNGYVWTKTASGESGNYTISASGTFASHSAAMLRITGANNATVSKVDGGNTTNDQTAECPNVTTSVANSMVLWVEFAGNGQTADSIDRGGASEVVDYDGGSGGDGGHISIWSEIIASPGSVTGAVITRSGFGGNSTFGIVIEPSGGGGAAPPPFLTLLGVGN